MDAVTNPQSCATCGSKEQLIVQGDDPDVICLTCLAKVDPARATVLAQIFQGKKSNPEV